MAFKKFISSILPRSKNGKETDEDRWLSVKNLIHKLETRGDYYHREFVIQKELTKNALKRKDAKVARIYAQKAKRCQNLEGFYVQAQHNLEGALDRLMIAQDMNEINASKEIIFSQIQELRAINLASHDHLNEKIRVEFEGLEDLMEIEEEPLFESSENELKEVESWLEELEGDIGGREAPPLKDTRMSDKNLEKNLREKLAEQAEDSYNERQPISQDLEDAKKRILDLLDS